MWRGWGVAGHLGSPTVWVVAADGGLGGHICSTIVTVTLKMASLAGPLSSSGDLSPLWRVSAASLGGLGAMRPCLMGT